VPVIVTQPTPAARPREVWLSAPEQLDVPSAPIHAIPLVMSDGQRPDNAPPPMLGEHTGDILAGLGLVERSTA
jgi:crotonobetainyl-CoA:carnitine CoA-transferase CaiB-like acyl-CoA transferase